MDWLTIATNFGLPTTGLVVLSYGIYRALVWTAVNILQPLALRHIKFLDELSTAMAAQSIAMQTMIVQQSKHQDQMTEVLQELRKMITMLEDKK